MGSLCVRSSWLRAAALAACLSVPFVTACTDPIYLDDAGDEAGEPPPDGANLPPSCEEPSCQTPAPMDGGTDGGGDSTHDGGDDAEVSTVPEGGLDAIRSQWVGLYATRSFLFAFDSPLETEARFLTLAEIKPSADGGLVLEEELCLYDGEWAFLVMGRLRVEFTGTRVSSALTFTADGFDSTQGKAAIGYEASASGCSEGGTAPARPHQVWLAGGSCDCLNGQPVPTSVRDCRLSDEDLDQKPGFTFKAMIGPSTYQYHLVQQERLRLLNGYKLGERLYADREFADTTNVLGCIADGTPKRVADCPLGDGWQCPANTQKAELVPLRAPLTCRQVIDREAGLFTSPQPSFPSSCRR
jgi:hypothetical protein